MPTIFRHAGLRFVIYLDDHPPPHVHVEGKGGQAKVALDGPELIWSRGHDRRDMKIALDAIESRNDDLTEAWTAIHG